MLLPVLDRSPVNPAVELGGSSRTGATKFFLSFFISVIFSRVLPGES